jgi:ATP-dependent DNA helicase RecQ
MINDRSNQAKKLLNDKFGFDKFRPGQEEAISSVLAERHALVMLPTGTGKTLCYQLPSYILGGSTVIISPLLSLMEDQVEKMKSSGEKSVVALNSFLSYSEKQDILRNLSAYKFIFVSPEMLQQRGMIDQLKKIDLALLVVDEAHCISQWGMDFRADYLKLGKVRHELNNPLTLALTATAVEQVRKDILSVLNLSSEVDQVIYPVDRPSIQLRVEQSAGDKQDRLLHAVSEFKGPGIVYFSSKKLADELAELIRSQLGIPCESYHSDLDKEDKRRIQSQFISDTLPVICATSAFGMGIDKPDIRFIIHYHLPGSPEMYLQEIGRCSRDRKGGVALLLYENGDEMIQRRLQENILPDRDELIFAYRHAGKLDSLKEDNKINISRHFIEQNIPFEQAADMVERYHIHKSVQLKTMIDYASRQGCKREVLLDYFVEKPEVRHNGCCSGCSRTLSLPYEPVEWSKILQKSEDMWQDKLKFLFNLQS